MSQVNITLNTNTVDINTTNNQIVVTDPINPTTVNITQPVTTIVEVITAGPQGPQGIPGSIPSTGSFVTTSSFNAFTSSYNTGSFTGSFTGSLFGTASWAINALTASYLEGYISPFPYTGSAQITGSLGVTGSINVTQGITGSLFGTASFAISSSNSISSSFATTSTSASFAISSSTVQSIANNITNNQDNYILTATGGSAINGEGNLTFDGGLLNINGQLEQGRNISARGDYSHAEGEGTIAPGNYSHAEGNETQATGDYSHAEGTLAQAVGAWSHAEGKGTVATGEYSHAEGRDTVASSRGSHAEGVATQAIGEFSHAEGASTVAQGNYQHVQGQYNLTSSVQSAFIHGNGTDTNNRSNLIFAYDSTVEITGSLKVSGSITGSLFGTASYALDIPKDATVVSGSANAVQSGGVFDALALKVNSSTATTGSVITFDTAKIYNTFTTPTTADITNDLTGAKIGVVQKIYSNKSAEPTYPLGWVKIGGDYTVSVVNIIYAEWSEGSRVEYWIIKG